MCQHIDGKKEGFYGGHALKKYIDMRVVFPQK